MARLLADRCVVWHFASDNRNKAKYKLDRTDFRLEMLENGCVSQMAMAVAWGLTGCPDENPVGDLA